MNSRRRSLLAGLPLFLLVLYVGQVGIVELGIWLTALALWLYGFVYWARDGPGT